MAYETNFFQRRLPVPWLPVSLLDIVMPLWPLLALLSTAEGGRELRSTDRGLKASISRRAARKSSCTDANMHPARSVDQGGPCLTTVLCAPGLRGDVELEFPLPGPRCSGPSVAERVRSKAHSTQASSLAIRRKAYLPCLMPCFRTAGARCTGCSATELNSVTTSPATTRAFSAGDPASTDCTTKNPRSSYSRISPRVAKSCVMSTRLGSLGTMGGTPAGVTA